MRSCICTRGNLGFIVDSASFQDHCQAAKECFSAGCEHCDSSTFHTFASASGLSLFLQLPSLLQLVQSRALLSSKACFFWSVMVIPVPTISFPQSVSFLRLRSGVLGEHHSVFRRHAISWQIKNAQYSPQPPAAA